MVRSANTRMCRLRSTGTSTRQTRRGSSSTARLPVNRPTPTSNLSRHDPSPQPRLQKRRGDNGQADTSRDRDRRAGQHTNILSLGLRLLYATLHASNRAFNYERLERGDMSMTQPPKLPPPVTSEEAEILRKLDEWTTTVRTTRTQGLLNCNMYRNYWLQLSVLCRDLTEFANLTDEGERKG